SAALAPATAERFLDAFGHAIRQGYGLAEIGALMVDVDAGENRTFGSVGRPLPGVRCRLTEEGEIVASSPALANGYLGRPDLWAEVVRDGELHTSDLARVDEDGRYFLTGRRSRLMNLDGRQVHPSEVEEVLLEVDAVREVIVVAEESPARVVAHVATAGEVDAVEELLREHCRTRLSAWILGGQAVARAIGRGGLSDGLPGRARGRVRLQGGASAPRIDRRGSVAAGRARRVDPVVVGRVCRRRGPDPCRGGRFGVRRRCVPVVRSGRVVGGA
ncbi:MAG: class I adenylate-forming enzyme family protein, partial [Planctomycetota bacterium]